jgi:hypothetical protein
MGTNAGPAAGAAVILLGILAIMLWKGVGKKSPAWIALAAGLCGSYIVVGYLGGLSGYSLAGVGITALIVILGGFVFWLEAVRGHKPHHIRTPVTAFILGVALMSGSSAVQGAVSHATTSVTNVVNHGAADVGGNG